MAKMEIRSNLFFGNKEKTILDVYEAFKILKSTLPDDLSDMRITFQLYLSAMEEVVGNGTLQLNDSFRSFQSLINKNPEHPLSRKLRMSK